MNVQLDCNAATVSSGKALEANSMHIQSCSRFSGKLVHADRLSVVSAGEVNIDSLYCKTADIQTGDGGIIVGQSHGLLQAFSSRGSISVGNSNGYVNLRTQHGPTVSFHLMQLPPAQERRCFASAPSGSVFASIERQVDEQMTLVCATSAGGTSSDSSALTAVPAAFNILKTLEGEELGELEQELGLGADSGHCTRAWLVENHRQTVEGSRTVDNTMQSGKINSFSAQKQSLDRFVDSAVGSSGSAAGSVHPLVVCVARDEVQITSDSWKDRISRKFNV
jgi:hypothetical protein